MVYLPISFHYKNYLFFILFLLILCITLYYLFFFPNREFYCNKTPSTNPFGAQNDKNVDLTYGPQNNIKNNNCDKYWKEYPKEYNTNFLEDIPLDRNSAYNILPETAQYGNNSYSKGLIDYNKLILMINDDKSIDPLVIEEEYDELLINPLTGAEEKYDFERKYDLYALNKKTWIHRAKEFDPTKKNKLDYNKIKSPRFFY